LTTFKDKSNKNILVLQFDTDPDYNINLNRLVKAIKDNPQADIIVAPEVVLTAFDYDNFDKVIEFYDKAIERLCLNISNQILALSLVRKTSKGVVNSAIIIHNSKVIYTQDKVKLFPLGEELKYFVAGDIEDIVKFKIDGVVYGLLICFELRFKEIWKRLEGCDIILVPSRWGLARKSHIEVLSQALAVMNQCYVVLSNSSDSDMASSSSIISPNGDVIIDDSLSLINKEIEFKEIQRVRRYIKMS